jgi:hypothetical protein
MCIGNEGNTEMNKAIYETKTEAFEAVKEWLVRGQNEGATEKYVTRAVVSAARDAMHAAWIEFRCSDEYAA